MTHQTRCVSPTVCCPLWPSLRDPWPQFPVGGHQRAFALLENIWSQSDLWYQESFSSSRNPLLVILEVAVRGEACEIFRADHLSSPGANTVEPTRPLAPFCEVGERDAVAGKSKDLRRCRMSSRRCYCRGSTDDRGGRPEDCTKRSPGEK